MSDTFVEYPAGNPFIEVSTSDAFATDLWICVSDPFSKTTYVAKPVDLVFEAITNRGVSVDPTLRLSGRFGALLLKSLVDKLANQGIKPDQEARNEGELKATKAHLEDMRNLALEGEPNLLHKDSPFIKMMEFEARATRAEHTVEILNTEINQLKAQLENVHTED